MSHRLNKNLFESWKLPLNRSRNSFDSLGDFFWGGIKEGVLFGFCYGNRLKDRNNYLTHGTNKQVFYKIYFSLDEINDKAIVSLLKEAIEVDIQFK